MLVKELKEVLECFEDDVLVRVTSDNWVDSIDIREISLETDKVVDLVIDDADSRSVRAGE